MKLGDQVILAAVKDVMFKIVAENINGTFDIEAVIGLNQVLRYENISKEMLRYLY